MGVVEKRERGEGIEQLGETEGARRATGVFPSAAPAGGFAAEPGAVETEVVAKAQRRRFTAEYKRRIVREADRCTKPGELGALLRREIAASSRGSPRSRAGRRRPRPIRGIKRSSSRSASSRGGSSAPSARRHWWRSKKKLPRSWGPRSRARSDARHGARGGTAARGRAHVRGARGCDGQLLPPRETQAGHAAAPDPCAGARTERAGGRARGPPRAPLRGPGAHAGLRAPARRGALPLLAAHDVPSPGRVPGGARAAGSAPPPALRRAAALGHAAQRGLELGHHEAPGPREVDVLLPLRDPRRVQPLR